MTTYTFAMLRRLPDEDQTKLWHQAFGVSVRAPGTDPNEVPIQEIKLALNLIFEEFTELLDSFKFCIGEGEDGKAKLEWLGDMIPDSPNLFGTQFSREETLRTDPLEIFDAILDTLFTLHGLATRLGLPTRDGFAEVTASNFSKLGADGKPILNGVTPGYRHGEAGHKEDAPARKVLKGPGFFPPNLAEVIASRARVARLEKETNLLEERWA